MPRITKLAWWCWCKQRNDGNIPRCSRCGEPRIEKHAQIHAAEHSVVYYNPATGEHRTPPRADQIMPEVYAKQGFERREIMSMTAWEKEAGVIHEASNFCSGNEVVNTEPAPPSAPSDVIDQLAKDWADAAASGPFTDNDNSPDTFTVAAPL
jgi:hypothetical protein